MISVNWFKLEFDFFSSPNVFSQVHVMHIVVSHASIEIDFVAIENTGL